MTSLPEFVTFPTMVASIFSWLQRSWKVGQSVGDRMHAIRSCDSEIASSVPSNP